MCVSASIRPEESVTVPVNPLRSTCAAQKPARKNNALNAIETLRCRIGAEFPANRFCFFLRRMSSPKGNSGFRSEERDSASCRCSWRASESPSGCSSCDSWKHVYSLPAAGRETHRLLQQRAFKRCRVCEIRSCSIASTRKHDHSRDASNLDDTFVTRSCYLLVTPKLRFHQKSTSVEPAIR